MGINHWPRHERPREKLIQQGANALSTAELLAIFLRTGSAGQSALELAQRLLQQFGGLRKLASVGPADFCSLPGLGPAKYAQLQAALALGERLLLESLADKPLLNSRQATERFLRAKLRDLPHESLLGLFLNNELELIACEELARDTHNQSRVYPREIVKRCLYHNASHLILAHNHPSGNPEPSQADIDFTTALTELLEMLDVELLEHVVIGNNAIKDIII